ncbi:MAG: patatin-like phospholipase family protein [Treponema sp.]|nr:patatin-like phospholipase family protein [Treponema sp.]
MKRIVVSIAFCFLLMSTVTAQSVSPDKKERPKVAVILSGGGAKGLAEIPLLEALEREGIPIDMIVGTSMGSMIGAMYSAGYTPKQIREIMSETDIVSLLMQFNESKHIPAEAFDNKRDNIFSLDITSHGLGTSPGILSDQGIINLLAKYLSRIPADRSFDELPIPFRSIGSDLITGKENVYDKGSLAQAVRNSMSLPFVWVPAIDDNGHYVLDGGLTNNLPIRLAKEMGADIVLVMDVSTHESKPEDLQSLNSIFMQLFAMLVYKSVTPQYEDADVLLSPNVTHFGTLQFAKSDVIVAEGEKCVQENYDQILTVKKRLQDAGVVMQPKDPDRISDYELMEDKIVESVEVVDASPLAPCPIPSPLLFQKYIGRKLDNFAINSLIRELDDMRQSFALTSLTFKTVAGADEHHVKMVVVANHYQQDSNKLFIGGSPSITFTNQSAHHVFSPSPDFTVGLKLMKPFTIIAKGFFGDVNGMSFDLNPKIAPIADGDVGLTFGGSFLYGNLHINDSMYNRKAYIRLENYGMTTNAGIQFHYVNRLSVELGAGFDAIWGTLLPFNPTVYGYLSGVYSTMDDAVSFNGLRVETLLKMGYAWDNNDSGFYTGFIYAFRAGISQRFELSYNKMSIGYDASFAMNHFPKHLTSSYYDYGGFNGMPGCPVGTYRTDFGLLGITYMHHLAQLKGFPLLGILQVKFGWHDGRPLFSGFITGDDPLAFMENWTGPENFDVGFGAYGLLKTPLGSFYLGGGINTHATFSICLGLM